MSIKTANTSNWFEERFLTGTKPYWWLGFSAFVIYFWTIFFGFTYLDDSVLILDNIYFLKDLGNIFRIFVMEVFHVLHASAAYYRPILTLTFMLDSQISGTSPWFYHFTNIAIHVATSLLLYIFLIKVEIRKELAFLFSLVFSIHPAWSQAVSWIPGRNDSLLAMFFLAAFIYFLKFIETKQNKDLAKHLAFFFLAIFTKESGVIIPILSLGYAYLVKRQKKIDGIWYLITGWGAIGIIWFILRGVALGENPTPYTLPFIFRSLFTNLPAVFLYLGKVLIPVNLSVLPTLEDSTLVYGIVVSVVLIAALIFSKNKNYPKIAFGLFFFFAFLLTSFIRPNTDYVADFIEHRMYLPIVGLFIVASEISFIKNLNFTNKKVLICLAVIISGLSVTNFAYTFVFRNKLAFWQNAVKNSPHHPLAHKNLGAMHYFESRYEEAAEEYKKSLELNPTETMVHNNLGVIHLYKNELNEAEKEFNEELKINPYYDNALSNLGLLYSKKGDLAKAEEYWLLTLQANPDHLATLKSLVVLYSERKDELKAKFYYNELVKRGVRL